MHSLTKIDVKSPIVVAASIITTRRSGESVGSGILAIDQGTSGTKALVVDVGGDVLSVVEIPVSLNVLGDGGVEQDPNELLASVLAAGRRAIEESRVDVVAVGVANQGETVLA
jgi:sugar (pentulose or hexulose) kinase